MNKINWKQKLTSRKFWAAIIAVITTILVAFNVPNLTIEQVVAVITAASVLIAYIVGEGLVDAARLKTEGEKEIAQSTYALMGLNQRLFTQSVYVSKPIDERDVCEKTKSSMESISPDDVRGI